METAQVTCRLSEGPCRHKETWWWNEEVVEAVSERKRKYGNWKKKNRQRHGRSTRSRQNAKRVISLAKGKKQKECTSDVNDVTGSHCLKGVSGKEIVDEKGIKDLWKGVYGKVDEERK